MSTHHVAAPDKQCARQVALIVITITVVIVVNIITTTIFILILIIINIVIIILIVIHKESVVDYQRAMFGIIYIPIRQTLHWSRYKCTSYTIIWNSIQQYDRLYLVWNDMTDGG